MQKRKRKQPHKGWKAAARQRFEHHNRRAALRTIACGLFPEGLQVEDLTPQGRHELRDAIDALLNMAQGNSMRKETGVEHIARDIREGRFPQRSEPKVIEGPKFDAKFTAKVLEEVLGALEGFDLETQKRLLRTAMGFFGCDESK